MEIKKGPAQKLLEKFYTHVRRMAHPLFIF